MRAAIRPAAHDHDPPAAHQQVHRVTGERRACGSTAPLTPSVRGGCRRRWRRGAVGRRRGSAARSRGRPCASTRRRAPSSTAGAKLRIERDARARRAGRRRPGRAARAWRGCRSRCLCSSHDPVEVVDRARSARSPIAVPDERRIGVDQRLDAKPARTEATVVGERTAEVADPDDGDRPVAGEAELAGDLVQEVLDVVADAPGAVGAEVREVLADLGRVHAGQLGQALRRDGRDLALAGLEEGPVVERQAGDGRLRDPASRRSCHPSVLSALRSRSTPLPAGYRACARVLKVCGHFLRA